MSLLNNFRAHYHRKGDYVMINVQIKKNGFYVNNLEGDNFYVNVRTGVIKVAIECTHGIGWVDIREWFDPLQVTGIVTIICDILDEIGGE